MVPAAVPTGTSGDLMPSGLEEEDVDRMFG